MSPFDRLVGQVVIALSFSVLWGCGGSSGGGYGSNPSPPPPPPAQVPTWAEVLVIINKDCASCHDGTKEPKLAPESVFRASPVAAKLNAGLMPPPPKTISDQDKAALLAFAASPAK